MTNVPHLQAGSSHILVSGRRLEADTQNVWPHPPAQIPSSLPGPARCPRKQRNLCRPCFLANRVLHATSDPDLRGGPIHTRVPLKFPETDGSRAVEYPPPLVLVSFSFELIPRILLACTVLAPYHQMNSHHPPALIKINPPVTTEAHCYSGSSHTVPLEAHLVVDQEHLAKSRNEILAAIFPLLGPSVSRGMVHRPRSMNSHPLLHD